MGMTCAYKCASTLESCPRSINFSDILIKLCRCAKKLEYPQPSTTPPPPPMHYANVSLKCAGFQKFAVRIVGNIVTGDVAQTQLAIDNGALQAFLLLLRSVSCREAMASKRKK